MAEGKYDRYFIEYDPNWFPEERRPVMEWMQNSIAKGSHFYLVHWMMSDVVHCPFRILEVTRPFIFI